MKSSLNRRIIRLGLFLAASVVVGCGGQEVVVYSALDREFSEPILSDFQKETGIRVLAKYDIESTKTVGLVTEIIHEKERPRCDVFWNNEILHTLRLEKLGLLDAYLSPAAKDFPSSYVSPDGHWHGFAARARILIVNTALLPDAAARPRSILDLADSKWKGKCAIALPLYGTTASHAAVLFAEWGEDRAKEYFRKVKANASVLSGNKQVALAVSRGQYAFGITDTDDAIIEIDKGQPVAIVPPDQGPDELGTLFIPNTLCVIKQGPNGAHARKLVDFLLRPEVETRLARGDSAQFPVNPNVQADSRVELPEPVKWMQVDFRAASDRWESAVEFFQVEYGAAN